MLVTKEGTVLNTTFKHFSIDGDTKINKREQVTHAFIHFCHLICQKMAAPKSSFARNYFFYTKFCIYLCVFNFSFTQKV